MDGSGHPSDPVVLYVHGSLKSLGAQMQKAGWAVPAANNFINDLKYGAAVPVGAAVQLADKLLGWGAGLLGKLFGHKLTAPTLPDPVAGVIATMPTSNLTLDGKNPVATFERDNHAIGGRQHIRVFDTGKKDAAGQPVYAVAATFEGMKLAWKPQTFFLDHYALPDVSTARDVVLASIQPAAKSITSVPIPFGGPDRFNDGVDVPDNRAYDVTLN